MCALAASIAGGSPAHAAPSADVVIAWSARPLGPLGDAIADASARAGAAYIDTSPSAAVLPDPEPLIKRGIVAFASLELDAALLAFDAAADLVDRTGAAGLDATTLTDLFLHRALTHQTRGDDARAWDDFITAAGIDPTRVLDPAVFPPRALERFGQAREHVAALPRGKVTLTNGGGCSVRIDGAAVSTNELELPFGKHWLDSTCQTRAPVRRRVTVDRVALDVAAGGDVIAPPEDAALVIQGRTASARAIVSVLVHPANAVVRRIGVDGKEQERVSVTLRGDRRDAGDVSSAVTRLLAPPPPPKATPWYRSGWVWAIAGAAVASAVLIPLAAQSTGEVPKPVVIPSGDSPWPAE